MAEESQESLELVRRAAAGNTEGWGALVERYRDRLQRMVALRMDKRMQRRVNASDIIQEAYVEAAQHLAEYVQDPKMPFFLWLRGIASNKLLELHRHHLGVKMRDAARDVAIDGGAPQLTTAAALAAALVGHDTRPDEAAMRHEMHHRLEEALDALDPLDREVLALRHFEQLSNSETATVLGIETSAASKRYLRALARLKGELAIGGDGSSRG